MLEELAGELAGELAPIAGDEEALLAKVEATKSEEPLPVVGFWVAAARQAGVPWARLAKAMGLTRPVAVRQFTEWVDRYSGQAKAPRGNLPAPLTRFVGREWELAEVARLIGGDRRLVTLIGPAGVGKSRLCLQAVASSPRRLSGGAWWVDLAPLADEGLVPQGVARCLSVLEQEGGTVLDALCAYLRPLRPILVLDNCEHLLGGCALLVDTLLRSCPELLVMATSRQALGVAGEVVWTVPTLTLPGEGVGPRGDAVELFCQRATHADADFELTTSSLSAVAEICRRLDGIPLAIELAAARVPVLSPAQIAARLDDRFALLVDGPRTVDSHHRTLAEALDWSHESLPEPDQALFRRLAVFAGTFGLAAVEEVCDSGDLVGAGGVLNLLVAVVARSLVVVVSTGTEARYRLLETMRAYATERLVEAGEDHFIGARHAAWCRRLSETGEPKLTGPDQRLWLDRLEADYENLRSALTWLELQGELEDQMALAGSLTLFWRIHSRFHEGRRWLEASLSSQAGTPAVRAKATWGAGFLAAMTGDLDRARRLLEESLALYSTEGNDQGRARCLLILADAQPTGGAAVARSMAEESVRLARRVGDAWCLAHALAIMGRAHVRMGQSRQGRAALEESIAVGRQARDPQGLRLGLLILGAVALAEGDYGRSEALLGEALELVRQLGDIYCVAMALTQLGRLAVGRGQWDPARQLLGEGLEMADQSGNPEVIAYAHCVWGRLAHFGGDLVDANEHFGRALALASDGAPERVWAMEGMGEAALAGGDRAGASVHLQAVVAGEWSWNASPLVARALYQLGELARADCRHDEAAEFHRRSLLLRSRTHDRASIPDSLEALAAVAVRAGRLHHGARLLGGAEAIRQTHGYAHCPQTAANFSAQVESMQGRLGQIRFEAARTAGAAMSAEELIAGALKRRGDKPDHSLVGAEALTPSELQVANLAAQGLSNPQIGAQLFMARRTARGHLSAVFAKLGIQSRKELAAMLSANDT